MAYVEQTVYAAALNDQPGNVGHFAYWQQIY